MYYGLTAGNLATILVDGSVIFLLIGVIMVTGIMRKRGREDDRLFFLLLLMSIALAAFDIIAYLADERTFSGARIINLGAMTAFYITFIVLFMVWLHYSLVRFAKTKKGEIKKHRWVFAPGMIMVLLLIVNLKSEWFFSVDEQDIYHHEKFYIVMFLVAVFYMVMTILPIARYRDGLDKKALIPIWIYIMPFVSGMLIHYYLGGISFTATGCAFSVLFTHMGSASEIVIRDVEGGESR